MVTYATPVVGRRAYDDRSGRIIPNVWPTIMLLDADIAQAAFLAFYLRVPVEPTPTEKIEWDTDTFLQLNDPLTANVSSTTTTVLPITTPNAFIPNTLWMNARTNEVVLVQSVNPANNTINVTRAVSALNGSGGTAPANMNNKDTMVRLGPAVGEVNLRQATQTTNPTGVTNFCQAMRWELQMSRRQKKREFLNDQDFTYQEKKIMLEARKQLNGMFLMGQKSRYTDPVQGDVTLTSGIIPPITTNILNVSGTLYEANWDIYLMQQGMRFGSSTKGLAASLNVIAGLTQMAKDRTTFFIELGAGGAERTPVGIQVLEYMTPTGKVLQVFEDRFLSENFNGNGVICDWVQLRRKVYSQNGINDELHIEENTQDPDDLGSASTLYADMGLQWGLEPHHGYITGVTGGAKGFSVS